MTFDKLLRASIVAQFGSEIEAGRHAEFPALKQLWLEDAAERAEERAHHRACVLVAADATDWLADN